MLQPKRRGGFSVASGNAHHMSLAVATRQFNIRNHRNSCSIQLTYQRQLIGDTGTLDHFCSCQNPRPTVSACFIRNAGLLQLRQKISRGQPPIRYEVRNTPCLQQQSSSNAASAVPSTHHLLLHTYQIFSVTTATTAIIMLTIQKRTTICDSG